MNEQELPHDHASTTVTEATPTPQHIPEAVALDEAAGDAGAEAIAAEAATQSAPETQPAAQTDAAPVTEADVPAAPQAAPADPVAKPQKPPKAPPTPAQIEARKRAQAAWEHASNAKTSGQTLTANVKSAIKGGLLLDVDGYRAFLPASQVRVPKGTAIETLVGQQVPVKVLDVDEARKRLVVSHRKAVEQERRQQRQELIASLEVGAERQATVVRIADFGAFVDLGGVDALIPLGELAFERVDKTTDVVNVGDTFPVKILRVEENGKKIAASRKGALHDPWREHTNIVRQGATVEGKVVSKEPRLEVEIAPGITGTLSDRDANPDEYEVGESIEVMVRSVDFRNRRIRLSTPHAAQSFSSSGFAPLGAELGIKTGE